MTEKREIHVHVPALTRVEGEGSLDLQVKDGAIKNLKLSIFEPPRYFEKFLEGREYKEVIDVVARICGICPIAYQMSAAEALEHAFGVDHGPWVDAMRRVFYCGEWLQSHSLHVHLLALPDFLGFDNAIAMGGKYPEEVKRGLRLQELGNQLISLLGARSVHPIGAAVGGFHRAPELSEVRAMIDKLKASLPEAEDLILFTASLDFPDDAQEFVDVSVRHPTEFPMIGDRIISSDGLDIHVDEYEEHFEEYHEPQSTALFSKLHGKPYLVGPLPRMNLNLDRIPAATQAILDKCPVKFPSKNMFHSIVARAVEIHIALVEAIRLLEQYQKPASPKVPVHPKAGFGRGASEAPRGILWHKYETDENGIIKFAKIVPPTSQNQLRIEEDLHRSLTNYGLHHSDEELRLRCEMVIRNYDPCISCSTHFIDLRVQRD